MFPRLSALLGRSRFLNGDGAFRVFGLWTLPGVFGSFRGVCVQLVSSTQLSTPPAFTRSSGAMASVPTRRPSLAWAI